MFENWQLRRRVVDAIIGCTQGFQSQVVRLDGAELIIGAIRDLSHTIDPLVSGMTN
jgi:hypothetical protein